MNRLNSRFFGSICVALVILVSSKPGLLHAQGVSVPSSLDQTAGVSSRGTHAPANTSGPTALPEAFSQMVIAPGFTLQLSIYGATEMDGTLTVDNGGNVSVPLVGAVPVAGVDLRTAEARIRQVLIDRQELVDPHVALAITGYPQTPVTVAGEVQTPGKYPIVAPESLLDLLAAAGGVTTSAGGEVEVDHRGASGEAQVVRVAYANGRPPDDARHTLVYPGDTVFVRRAGVVFVLGAVNRPGGYLMVNGESLNVPQAVALASGTLPVASTGHAIVIRKGPDGMQKIEVALRSQDKGDEAPFVLQPGDMLYVPTSGIKATLYNASAVLNAAASAAVYSSLNR